MRYSITCISVLSVSLLTACETTSPTGGPHAIQPRPSETYTHAHSQFRFPAKVGNFDREAVAQYDAEGSNVSVGYNDLRHGIALTVFIYPIPQRAPDDMLPGHFGTCKAEVLGRHSGARLVSEGAVQVSPGGQQRRGQCAAFTFTDLFAHQRQPVGSELYLFVQGRSFIKYRATYAVGQQAAAGPLIRAFIDELAWP